MTDKTPRFTTVPKDLPDPPYPPDTRVKGWRFQLDHERIQQSDTWALSPADMRPWLLMLWHIGWQQTPAGSFPNEDRVIAAKIGMDVRIFTAHRDILMRGWRLHSDGRLYHQAIVEQVQQYQEFNRKERERVAAWRAAKKAEKETESNAFDTRNKHVSTTPEPEPEPDISVLSYDNTCQNSAQSAPVSTRADPVPYAKITELWGEICPHLPQPVKLSPARKAHIKARWMDELPDLDAWRECFSIVARSPFLSGRTSPPPGRKPFAATLDWVAKQENLLKIYEGRYDG